MILEGLLTTEDEAGAPHLAPMGPIVDEWLTRFVLRPFRTSTTYRHLVRTGLAVFHVTDDVELIARAAIGRVEPLPPLTRLPSFAGFVLTGACRWFALRATSLDDSQERTRIECQVVERGTLRDFFGFNRAKHAVLEAAILATRLHLLPAEEVRGEFARLAIIVEKTAGDQERRAFDLLQRHLAAQEVSSSR